MFVIELVNGEKITETNGETLTINPNTGVVSVSRIDVQEVSATHYSPIAWARVRQSVQRNIVTASPDPAVLHALRCPCPCR